jgi:hypothetical protein
MPRGKGESSVSSHQDEHCPNCGLLRPLDRVEVKNTKTNQNDFTKRGCLLVIAWIATVFIVFAIVLKAIATPEDIQHYGDAPFFILMLIIFGGIPFIVINNRKAFIKAEALRNSQPPQVTQNLMGSERIINQRLSEIRQRDAQITGVMERASKNTGEQWSGVRKTLTTRELQRKVNRSRNGAVAKQAFAFHL